MRDMNLEHPVITNIEQTGYPDSREPEWPVCPVCGKEAETFYYSSQRHEIVGCELCLTARESWLSWEAQEA